MLTQHVELFNLRSQHVELFNLRRQDVELFNLRAESAFWTVQPAGRVSMLNCSTCGRSQHVELFNLQAESAFWTVQPAGRVSMLNCSTCGRSQHVELFNLRSQHVTILYHWLNSTMTYSYGWTTSSNAVLITTRKSLHHKYLNCYLQYEILNAQFVWSYMDISLAKLRTIANGQLLFYTLHVGKMNTVHNCKKREYQKVSKL